LSKALAPLAGALALCLAAACSATGPAPTPDASTAAERPEAQTDASGGAAPGRAPGEPVRIAFLAPLGAEDGGLSRLGAALANAGRMALAERGGGGRIEMEVLDTGGRPAEARRAAERALRGGADVLLGPLLAGSVREARAAAEPSGTRVIAFSTDAAVAGDPVWLAGFLPGWEAQRVLSYAADQGLRRVGLFAPDTAYGRAARRGADEAARAGVVEVVAAATYPRSFEGIQDAAPGFAEAAAAAGAEALLLPAGGQELQAVGSFLNYHELDPASVRYLGLGQWNAGASLREPALQGGWFPAPDPRRVETFAARYEARHDERPPVLAALGYDVVSVAIDLARSARVAGRADPFAPESLTRAAGFEGALGALRFTPDGLNERGMAILEVGPRGFEVLEPAPAGFPAGS
jgi:ABC-type branched-subunit amino acid transport system substrate-binding protein